MLTMVAASLLAAGALGGTLLVGPLGGGGLLRPRRYVAEQFLQAKSYALAGSGDDAFTVSSKSLLVTSDESGTFNAYLLPLAGDAPVPLTRSTTNATWAVTTFPKDVRVLVSSGGDELSRLVVHASKADFVGCNRNRTTFFVSSKARERRMASTPMTSLSRAHVFRNGGSFQVKSVSSDRRTLALTETLSSANADPYVADLAVKAPRPS